MFCCWELPKVKSNPNDKCLVILRAQKGHEIKADFRPNSMRTDLESNFCHNMSAKPTDKHSLK